MSSQKSFMFYLSWEEQLSVLSSDEERWNFVHNLIRYHKGEELEFKSDMVRLIWLGVKIPVEENIRKWNERANNSRINGKKHTGKKNQIIEEITQQVFSEPKEPVKSKESNTKSQISNTKSQIVENQKNKIIELIPTIPKATLELCFKNYSNEKYWQEIKRVLEFDGYLYPENEIEELILMLNKTHNEK